MLRACLRLCIYLALLQVKENLPIVEMLRELAASYFKRGSEDRKNRFKGTHSYQFFSVK
jgi:hypothetical protein